MKNKMQSCCLRDNQKTSKQGTQLLLSCCLEVEDLDLSHLFQAFILIFAPQPKWQVLQRNLKWNTFFQGGTFGKNVFLLKATNIIDIIYSFLKHFTFKKRLLEKRFVSYLTFIFFSPGIVRIFFLCWSVTWSPWIFHWQLGVW